MTRMGQIRACRRLTAGAAATTLSGGNLASAWKRRPRRNGLANADRGGRAAATARPRGEHRPEREHQDARAGNRDRERRLVEHEPGLDDQRERGSEPLLGQRLRRLANGLGRRRGLGQLHRPVWTTRAPTEPTTGMPRQSRYAYTSMPGRPSPSRSTRRRWRPTAQSPSSSTATSYTPRRSGLRAGGCRTRRPPALANSLRSSTRGRASARRPHR